MTTPLHPPQARPAPTQTPHRYRVTLRRPATLHMSGRTATYAVWASNEAEAVAEAKDQATFCDWGDLWKRENAIRVLTVEVIA